MLTFVPEARVVEYYNVLSKKLPENAPGKVNSFVDFMGEKSIGHKVYERVDGDDDGLIFRLKRKPV